MSTWCRRHSANPTVIIKGSPCGSFTVQRFQIVFYQRQADLEILGSRVIGSASGEWYNTAYIMIETCDLQGEVNGVQVLAHQRSRVLLATPPPSQSQSNTRLDFQVNFYTFYKHTKKIMIITAKQKEKIWKGMELTWKTVIECIKSVPASRFRLSLNPANIFPKANNLPAEHAYLASSNRGSNGGYMARTTSSTRGLIRFAIATMSVSDSGLCNCLELPIVIPTSFSVKLWQMRRIARQWGTRPLKKRKKNVKFRKRLTLKRSFEGIIFEVSWISFSCT